MLAEKNQAFIAGEFSLYEAVERALKNIRKTRTLNAYISVCDTAALNRADKL
jgi:Asp-tRNA(Asn)/Glu-tRNA(Gln) amidotransferase A subunit family amidase